MARIEAKQVSQESMCYFEDILLLQQLLFDVRQTDFRAQRIHARRLLRLDKLFHPIEVLGKCLAGELQRLDYMFLRQDAVVRARHVENKLFPRARKGMVSGFGKQFRRAKLIDNPPAGVKGHPDNDIRRKNVIGVVCRPSRRQGRGQALVILVVEIASRDVNAWPPPGAFDTRLGSRCIHV